MIDTYTLLVIGHIVGVALGVGGATASDVIFLRGVTSGVLDRSTLRILKTMSVLVWTGLAILIVSGIGFLLLTHAERPTLGLIPSEKVAAKLSIVGILTLNGLVFATVIQPLLEHWEGKTITAKLIRPHLTLILTCGAISVTSWYATLILGAIGKVDVTYGFVMGLYGIVLLGVIAGAQLLGRWYLGYLTRRPNR